MTPALTTAKQAGEILEPSLADEELPLPHSIARLLPATGSYELDTVGRTGSVIRLYEKHVLKVQVANEESRRERDLLVWLRGRLPVPELVAWEEADGLSYLLESRVPGRMLAEPELVDDGPCLVSRLAEALRLLADVEVSDCPYAAGTDDKLHEARQRVEAGLVSLEDAEEGTFGPGGFASPEVLLQWLHEHQPPPETGFIHGDCCLPNILAVGGRVSGFIDLGRGGRGDRWLDIALAIRSLRYNHGGRPGLAQLEARLYCELGLEADPERVRYYILLDELF